MGVNWKDFKPCCYLAGALKKLLACNFFAGQPKEQKTSFLNILGGNAPEITGLSLF